MDSAQLRAAIREAYNDDGHVLLWEVANSTGSQIRRYADCVCVGIWPSTGFEIEGIEIKVSRQDFLSEMANPQKSNEILKYCDKWWLAAPKGLVLPDQLPKTWGLLECDPDTLKMKVKKKAPRLSPEPLAPGFVAAMLRRHAGADDAMVDEIIEKRTKDIRRANEETIRARVGHELQYARQRLERDQEKIKKIQREVQERIGIDILSWRVHDDIATVLDFLINNGGAQKVSTFIHQLESLLEHSTPLKELDS